MSQKNNKNNQESEFVEIFNYAGIKPTEKRIAIFKGLKMAGKALSPYELVQYCKQNLGLTLPAVSIYRILDLLVAADLVHKLDTVNKYICCTHIDCHKPHPHTQFLICSLCQKVEEVHMPAELMAQLSAQIQSHGYQLNSPQFEFQGICTDCQALEEEAVSNA
ncbi:Fur family transcriptional regulator [Pseudoalteromonas umbrosa]|uniref:Fur family transcriptional regulator n=1 Tax=Pseudoalteromonas umbrosa TaxID=3048489 RepID=UPI0024C42385|nr:transcriptional repressor [Pseudoalteromonas sp. B95]MDK1289889.1 transcriptional repressor [Pseudoalteromonas sp. B95]